jgi:hypothetical protein
LDVFRFFSFAGFIESTGESPMADKLIIFDTTLRDGEQSPGASMTRDEKLRIARQLERLRVDVIEAGFAASSNGDFEAVKAIANAVIKDSVGLLAFACQRPGYFPSSGSLEGCQQCAHAHSSLRPVAFAYGKKAAHDTGSRCLSRPSCRFALREI